MSGEAVYIRIAEKLDRHAAGAPRSEGGFSRAFIDYLKILYPPEAAEVVQHLKVTREFYASGYDVSDYTSVGRLAEISGKSVEATKRLLDPLVRKSALISNQTIISGFTLKSARNLIKALRIIRRSSGFSGALRVILATINLNTRNVFKYGPRGAGGIANIPMYALPIYPSLLNVHQFYPETSEEDIRAGELYQEYFIRDGYYRYYEGSEKGTPTWRTIPVRRTILSEQMVLDSEEAHAIIDAAVRVSLVACPCRTRTEKLGIRECRDKNPVGACIMLGLSAMNFDSSGLGRPVSRDRAKQYLNEMQDLGLVATTENFSSISHSVICLCCRCCCSMLRGRTRWDNPSAVLPSNFIPAPGTGCAVCGTCHELCPLGAITVNKETGFSVDLAKCIGCGICTLACPQDTLKLRRRERSSYPLDARDLYQQIERENNFG